MPSLQRYEGTDLEEVLEEVYDKHGHDVVISEANKIRKGGIGGFFARELFEVVVDLSDGTPPSLALDDAGSEPRVPAPSATTNPTARPARSVFDLVDEVQDGVPDGLASPETVADLVRRTADGPERPMTNARSISAAELFGGATATPARDEPAPAVSPTMQRVSTDTDAFADVLARIATQTAEPEPLPPSEPDAPFVAYGSAAPGTTTEEPPAPVRERRRRTRNKSIPSETPPPPGPPALPFKTADLVSLGMPLTYLRDDLHATEQLSALLEIASQLPVAPTLPREQGTVIALIGDRRGLVEAAEQINEELRLNPDRMMVASRNTSSKVPMHRRIESIDDALNHRRNWRRRDEPTLVLVDEPVSRVRTSWSRHLLEALEPATTWGAVEAQRKPEDVSDWAERLGGVDALAVFGTDETTSPAAVLTTGLPVGLLDGRFATAARWAAVLDERLYAA